MPKLILIDGSSYLYRAFHALPPLTASDGTPSRFIREIPENLIHTIRAKTPSNGNPNRFSGGL